MFKARSPGVACSSRTAPQMTSARVAVEDLVVELLGLALVVDDDAGQPDPVRSLLGDGGPLGCRAIENSEARLLSSNTRVSEHGFRSPIVGAALRRRSAVP